MTATSIARLKVTLDHVKPLILRRIEVPLTITLDRLHLVLQATLGWTNTHLYEIRASDIGWGIPDPDYPGGPLDARKARLVDIVEDTGARKLHYLYDFGDGWEHTIRIEQIATAIPGITYPNLIEAAGRCPPEDCGGPWGYEELLAAIVDPSHEQHTESVEWVGGHFDPTLVSVAAITRDLNTLARKWARKPAAKPKSTN